MRWTTEVGEEELGNLALGGGDVSLATGTGIVHRDVNSVALQGKTYIFCSC